LGMFRRQFELERNRAFHAKFLIDSRQYFQQKGAALPPVTEVIGFRAIDL
jgi:hypothetical protein